MKMNLWFKDLFESIIIVSPYYEGATLDKFVDEYWKNNGELDDELIYKILGQIIGGLQALFDSFKISHRDLKP